MHYIRGKGKHNCDYSLKDLYKEYKKTVKNPVEYKIYAEFLKEYNERIINEVIYRALEYKLPYKLGFIRVQRRKLIPYVKDGKLIKKHIPIDWDTTKKHWEKEYPGLTPTEISNIPDKKLYYHTNKHTNGYSTRFFWDKTISTTKNQTAYIFKATRTAKETLAKFIKEIKIIEYFD